MNSTADKESVGTEPMQPYQYGRYVCVAKGGCRRSPYTTIMADGVWVKTGKNWSSNHRTCFEATQSKE